MRKNFASFIVIAIALSSCCNQGTAKNEIALVETGLKFETERYNPVNTKEKLSEAPITKSWGKKPEVFVNEELPKSYTDRLFLKSVAGSTYDLNTVPGYIIKYDSVTRQFQRMTLVPLIINNKTAIVETIADGLIYSHKINKGASFNGSFVIGTFQVSDNQIMELVVQDVAKSTVPDSLIDTSAVSLLKERIPSAEKNKYFYVKNAVLTIVNSRKFKESKFESKVNATYVTAEGKVYNTDDKLSRDRLISVELVALDGLLTK